MRWDCNEGNDFADYNLPPIFIINEKKTSRCVCSLFNTIVSLLFNDNVLV